MRVLITGITGFAGSHLAELYLGRTPDLPIADAQVYGLVRPRSPRDFIRHFQEQIQIVEGDVTDAHAMERVIAEVAPDVVHHLAGQSFVPLSWRAPTETFQANLIGPLNLFEAIRRCRPEAVVQVASSSEIYGRQVSFPVTEKQLPEPMSPYAVSKLAMDRLAYQYVRSYGLKVVVTRAFNHTGPRRGLAFVTSSFAKQIVEIERSRRDSVISVGNIEAERDWTDVRDVARAYALSVQHCLPGEPYNIASGRSHKVSDLLKDLLALSAVKASIQVDPERNRPSDVPKLCGDSTRFRKQTGWEPKIPWEKTLRDLLDYWRLTLDGRVWQPDKLAP